MLRSKFALVMAACLSSPFMDLLCVAQEADAITESVTEEFTPQSAGEVIKKVQQILAEKYPAGIEFEKQRELVFARMVQIEKLCTLGMKMQMTDEERFFLVKRKAQCLGIFAKRGGSTDAMEKTIELLEPYQNDPYKELSDFATTVYFETQIMLIPRADQQERQQKIDLVMEKLNSMPVNDASAKMAAMMGSTVARMNEPKIAVPILEKLVAFFKNSDDSKYKKTMLQLEGTARQINLPGNELQITGKTFQGETFDWQAQKGKVVLVDFWATWCGPCVAEFPSMERMYEIYHPHGFEIVGISLDDDKEKLASFLERKGTPWVILFNQSEDKEKEGGWADPNAVYYGVSGIPTMFLVDKNGKVISTTARGKKLENILAELYPEVVVPESTKKVTEESVGQ